MEDLANVTPLEAFCLATAVATYISASDPDAVNTITSLADNIYRAVTAMAGTNADSE